MSAQRIQSCGHVRAKRSINYISINPALGRVGFWSLVLGRQGPKSVGPWNGGVSQNSGLRAQSLQRCPFRPILNVCGDGHNNHAATTRTCTIIQGVLQRRAIFGLPQAAFRGL